VSCDCLVESELELVADAEVASVVDDAVAEVVVTFGGSLG
jgi:hypothetical protein